MDSGVSSFAVSRVPIFGLPMCTRKRGRLDQSRDVANSRNRLVLVAEEHRLGSEKSKAKARKEKFEVSPARRELARGPAKNHRRRRQI
jgi:hypothetical protein